MPARPDALILTALRDELEALLGRSKKFQWTRAEDARGFPHHHGSFRSLRVVAAWTGEMGEVVAAARAGELIDELQPKLLAMCGTCAGRRGKVSLGDVIVADRVYSYDHGQILAARDGEAASFLHDIETYNLDRAWRMAAVEMDDDLRWKLALARRRPPSLAVQRAWVLETLYEQAMSGGPVPHEHPQLRRRCPSWKLALASLQADELVRLERHALRLTSVGETVVLQTRISEAPRRIPLDPRFTVHVGAIATGKVVQRDPDLFGRLERSVRGILGVDMEAAAIGVIATRRGLPHIVVKAVTDFADVEKDDSFRKFACEASAEFLLELLQWRLLPPEEHAQVGGEAELLDGVVEVAGEELAGEPPASGQDFSPLVVQRMSELRRIIKSLTEEQYRVLDFLTGHSRVWIRGCAGSGKTLVAVEKAIRLARAGLRTLILCHNPHLAEYIRQLTSGSPVDVFDFGEWVRMLCGHAPGASDEWMPYAEPTNEELGTAFDQLTHETRYDAVVVDEGQDFRETWWTLVEAALKDSGGLFYVFSDDNQALLPHRGRPPIVESPFKLSRNCRNAGKIFDLVRQVHPCAPEASLQLAEGGRVEWCSLPAGADARAMVGSVLSGVLVHARPEDIVVLTTEPDPTSRSILHGLDVAAPRSWQWQDAVRRHLATLSSRELPALSAAPFPTEEDIWVVREFVRGIPIPHEIVFRSERRPLQWRAGELLVGAEPAAFRVPRIAAFFQSEKWVEGIPPMNTYRVVAGKDAGSISLYTIGAFKGLEADAVVLFAPRAAPLHRSAASYVGISRARLLLCVVTPDSSELYGWEGPGHPNDG